MKIRPMIIVTYDEMTLIVRGKAISYPISKSVRRAFMRLVHDVILKR